MMGGVRVDAETQMSNVPGLFAAGECAAGLHGANRLGGNSLSDLLVFGKRAGEHAAEYAKQHPFGQGNSDQVEAAARQALEPFDRPSGESPFLIQRDLQAMMQDLVGIVRREEELKKALTELERLEERTRLAGVTGHREYNPGWHTALDLSNMLAISKAITLAAIERKESRGAHFRDDFPSLDSAAGNFNLVVRSGIDGEMQIARIPRVEMPQELKQIIEEMK
jgi:succinate dehydrogenase / fumarate reductase flavoprotein subunit